jgi:hypothetical protein
MVPEVCVKDSVAGLAFFVTGVTYEHRFPGRRAAQEMGKMAIGQK